MKKRFRLKLLGVVDLRAPSGKDVTPRLRKSRALLAYLAMASGRPVERVALERLLWSDRMPRQARDSLKQSLTELRRAFADAVPSPLVTDGGPVRLCLDRIEVDALQDLPANAPRLLEGMGLTDPDFIAWIARERDRLDRTRCSGRMIAPDHAAGVAQFRIAILPPVTGIADGATDSLAGIALDGLARALDHIGLFQILDRRPTPGGHVPPAGDCDMCLVTTTASTRDQTLLSFSVKRMATGAVIWSTTEIVERPLQEPARLYRMAAHHAEQIGDAVWQHWSADTKDHSTAVAILKAIHHISRLSPGDIAAADCALAHGAEVMPSAALYAWRAYLTAYQLEKGTSREDLRDRAIFYSARALELDRRNPLARALVAHAHSFVLHDHERAREILSPVRGQVGQSAILADTVGLVHFYSGRYDEACAHARLACDLGRWSPMRYAFTTLLSASHMMLGEFGDAIHAGRRALAQHPAGIDFCYEPTLRTLAAACALDGRLEEGRVVLDTLDRQTGRQTAKTINDIPATVYPNPDVFKLVKRGIESLCV